MVLSSLSRYFEVLGDADLASEDRVGEGKLKKARAS